MVSSTMRCPGTTPPLEGRQSHGCGTSGGPGATPKARGSRRTGGHLGHECRYSDGRPDQWDWSGDPTAEQYRLPTGVHMQRCSQESI